MKEQLGLFGDAPATVRETALGPAPVSPELQALATSLPAGLKLGTSSWYFPGWNGIVFDRAVSEQAAARDGLAAYARHPLLRTVGIDRTFYAPLSIAQYTAYAKQVPDEFRFLVKAPATITSTILRTARGTADNAHFLRASHALEYFLEPCLAGLADKCGVLLFQFSPLGKTITSHPDRFANQLYRFLDALPAGLPCAVEVRDPELLVERFFKALDAGNARYCVGVHPRMPDTARQIELASGMRPGPFIARWNLHGGFAYEQAKSRYAPFNRLVDEDPVTRGMLATASARALHAGHPATIIINNKAEGSAPLSVFKLAAAIAQAAHQP